MYIYIYISIKPSIEKPAKPYPKASVRRLSHLQTSFFQLDPLPRDPSCGGAAMLQSGGARKLVFDGSMCVLVNIW